MSPARPVVVGVDGGGSALRALVLDAGGAELARSEVPSVRFQPGAPARVVGAVKRVVEDACTRAAVARPVGALWVGLAGAGREAVSAELQAALAAAGVAARVGVGTDAEAAFHDAFAERPGVILLAGTGSIAWGRGEDGREGRVGGWGSLLGDEGSGYAIGVEALKRVARSADGRAPATGLSERLLAHLGLAQPEELIAWSSTASRADVAALVPEVTAVAASGDPVAGELLVQAVAELEGHVLTILSALGPWRRAPTIALGGGLLQEGGPLRGAIEQALGAHRLPLLDRAPDPARGAARKALRL